MDADDLRRWRLRAQHLTGPGLPDPVAVARHLVAVQAQDHDPALWSVAQRTSGHAVTDLDAAYDAGMLLRTHLLRPTWHLVTPEDLGWLLALTAPRVHRLAARQYREAGLVESHRSLDVVQEALAEGPLTRAELRAALAAAGMEMTGQHLGYVLLHAELDGLVVSGPRRGRQHTHVLLDGRAPALPAVDRAEALAALALRFFTGHGPATAEDLAGWATLTLTDARGALAAVADRLTSVQVDGRTWWAAAGSEPPARARDPEVHLLQPYDEVVGYGGGLFDAEGVAYTLWRAKKMPFNAVLSVDGRLAGFWRRPASATTCTIEVSLVRLLDRPEQAALDAEVDRYGHYLGRTASLRFVPPAG